MKRRASDSRGGGRKRRTSGTDDINLDGAGGAAGECVADVNPADETNGTADAVAQGEDAGTSRTAAPRTAAHIAARRRAAHFALHAGDDDEEEEANAVHTGGDNARSLGPFASARQLVQGRAAALAARSDKILDEARATRTMEDELSWKTSRQPGAPRRQAECEVPSLFGLCTALLAEHIEDVESLWGLPDAVKVRLAAAVVKNHGMTAEVARLFTEGGPSQVILQDCTKLEPAGLADSLRECATDRLEHLELGFCGRPFGEEAANALAATAPLSGLRVLALGGAYRLTDGALGRILRASPNLRELRLREAMCLTGEVIEELPQLTPELEVLDLFECRGIGGSSLGYALTGLPKLRVLNLGGNSEVSDSLLAEASLVAPLREVSLNRCAEVTDTGVAALAAGNPDLEVLRLDEVSKLTAIGLAAVAESCRRLRVLSIRGCTRVSDDAVAAIAQHGALEQLDVSGVLGIETATVRALATFCKDRLQTLDVSFCRQLGDAALGMLADSCPQLSQLVVYGCSSATRTFLDGHSNDCLAVIGSNDIMCAA